MTRYTWLLALTLLAACHQSGPLGASGTVEATEAQLGFQAPGRIESIRVKEGDAVKAGDTLATLDRSEMAARRAQAAAQLSAARAGLAEMEHGSRPEEKVQADAAARAANDRLADAQRDLDRTRHLLDAGAVSQEQYDKARLQLDVLQSQKSQAEQQQQLVQTGPRPERIDAQRAAVTQAEAQIAQLDAMLANAVIRAPFNGVVTVKDREMGETVPAGAPVVTIINIYDRWVRIYIPEDQLGAIHLGDQASITSDTYKTRHYGGRVSFISSQAEFTPRNVQTKEERVKLVYAVKVSITQDSAQDLKPGIPADVVLGH
ncbi:MAG TPA: HlyD family efflux transporter periplasmic adaptor subunit [Gemmatimonadales bacterium]|jgi:HlyD family secretion protein